ASAISAAMAAEVLARFGQVHRCHLVARGDALPALVLLGGEQGLRLRNEARRATSVMVRLVRNTKVLVAVPLQPKTTPGVAKREFATSSWDSGRTECRA